MALSKAWAAVPAHDTTSGTVLTTGTFDSTGYTHLVVALIHEGATTVATPSDNKGSTGWASLTKQSNGAADAWNQLAWVKIGTPGAGHTVTMTLGAARVYRKIHVWLVNSGTGELDLDVQATNTGSGTAIDCGSLATTAATVSFMSVTPYAALGGYTQGTGWTEDYDPSTGVGDDYSYAQSRSDASGTLDPACTGDTTQDWAAVSASFKEASGGSSISSLRYLDRQRRR